jgi:hypothetical protein
MKSSWDKQLGLASPRESAAGQSDQTNAFSLDILFHRMSVIAIFRQLSIVRVAKRSRHSTVERKGGVPIRRHIIREHFASC